MNIGSPDDAVEALTQQIGYREQLRDAILSATPDHTYVLDRQMRYLFASPSGAAAIGFDPGDMVGKTWEELDLPAEIMEPFLRHAEKVFVTGEGLRGEIAFPTVSGIREFEYILTPIRDAEGYVPMVLATARDITERQAGSEGERLRMALDAGRMGTWAWNISTNALEWSERLERIHGLDPGTFDGTFEGFIDVVVPEDRDRLSKAIMDALESKGDFSTEFRVVHRDGSIHWVGGQGRAIFNEAGEPLRMIGIGFDLTDRKKVERERLELVARERAARSVAEGVQARLAFLAEASDVLAGSLDYRETLERVARLAVPRIADWCGIDMARADGTMEPVAAAHMDPEKEELLKRFRSRYPPDPEAERGSAQVMRTGRPEFYPSIPDELLVEVALDEEHLTLMRELELKAGMVVPLEARGRILGVLTLISATPDRWNESDLRFVEDLARRCAVAVDNARLFEERAYVARTLQRALLPPTLPEVPGAMVASRYVAAGEGNEVGGDFYDVFEIGEGRWGLLMGDVVGKGAEAAALTGLVRHTVRAAAMQDPEPTEVLTRLNNSIYLETKGERFCTVAYLLYEPGDGGGRLAIACAGHPPPLVRREDGSVEEVPTEGMLLGPFEKFSIESTLIRLGPGDAVILYTDGLIEARDASGRELNVSGLRSILERADGTAEELAETLEASVLKHQSGAVRDDLALLCLKVHP